LLRHHHPSFFCLPHKRKKQTLRQAQDREKVTTASQESQNSLFFDPFWPKMLFEPFGKLRAGSSEFIFGRFLGTFSKKVPKGAKRMTPSERYERQRSRNKSSGFFL